MKFINILACIKYVLMKQEHSQWLGNLANSVMFAGYKPH